MIVPGSTSQELGAALAAELDEPLAVVERTDFSDGEFKLRVPIAGERAVVVVATTSADAHLELLQLQDAVREAGAAEVVTVVPYMGYGRQDSAFREGEPVTARAVARAVSTGTDRVLVVNPHTDGVCGFFDVPCVPVDAASRLADSLPALTDPLFLSPDEGAIDLAATVRGAYGDGDTDHFVKHRDYDSGDVSIEPSGAPVAGRDVVLVDDIVATGGTMATAIEHLRREEPRRVFVTCVHAMLAGSARSRLARAGVEAVVGTDTIERPVSRVSVAPALAEHL